MRNYCLVLLVCLGCFWALEAQAQQAPSQAQQDIAQAEEQEDLFQMEEQQDPAQSEEQQDPEQAAAQEPPVVSGKEAMIRLKRDELNDVEKDIKALRRVQQGERQAEQLKIRAEKQSRLEALKLQDPVKYQEELAKQFERQKKREKVRQDKLKDGFTKPKMTHVQWLEYIKKRNPKMYELVVKKDKLQEELKGLKSGSVP